MKKYTIVIITLLLLTLSARSQTKSILRVYPLVDTSKITTILDTAVIAENGNGQWWIGDGDPNSAVNNTQWIINKGNNAPYDEAYGDYVVELIGHRKVDDEENVNSFMLWAPSDSGVPWNFTNSVVKFDVRIVDGEDWKHNNPSSYQLGLYFWVAIQHGWDDKPVPKWVCFQQGPYLESLWAEGDPYYWWSDYFFTGLGDDLADGNWHTYQVDLIKVIEKQKQFAIDAGVTDPYLIGSDSNSPDYKDPSEGVHWKWFGVLGLEIYGLNVRVGNVMVLPDSVNTKVDTHITKTSIDVYPNPARGYIHIRVIEPQNEKGIKVSLFDIAGGLKKSYEKLSSPVNLDISDLNPGCYFLRIENKTETLTRKLIVY